MNNNQDIFNKLVEKAKETKLSEHEKSVLFSAVDSYVSKNPIKSPQIGKEKNSRPLPVKSPFTFGWSIKNLSAIHGYGLYAVVAILVVAISGAGTSFAAINSLPGDIFYPIKVNVNEGIKSALLSGVREAEYEIERAKRRVDEVKELVVRDKMSDELQVKIANRLNSHVSQVKKGIDDLTQKGEYKKAYEISTRLETSLEEGENAILALGKESSIPQEKTLSAKNIISVPLESSIVARESTEDQIYTKMTDKESGSENDVNDADTKEIAQAKFESVKNKLAHLEGRIAVDSTSADLMAIEPIEPVMMSEVNVRAKSSMPATGTAGVASTSVVGLDANNDLLIQAHNLLKEGEIKLENKEYSEAFRLFREAQGLAEIVRIDIDLQNEPLDDELENLIEDLNTGIIEIDVDIEVDGEVRGDSIEALVETVVEPI